MANVMTPQFRVSYPNVFKPKVNKMSGKAEYSVMALFPKGADLSALKAAAEAAIIKQWGADKANWPMNLRSPFRKQEELAKIVDGKKVLPAGCEEGGYFINLKAKQKPGVVDQNVQDIIDETQFYAGCYARATVNAFAYDQVGNRGVSFGLNNIQKLKDGEPLSGRPTPNEEFAPIEGAAAGTATTSGLFD